ncbi:MAG: glycosyltransferase [Clostridiales bacterium]|nr:glycosyltransferase [Clostridiales bacterium]
MRAPLRIYFTMNILALCMIVKNEEKTLSRAVSPLLGVVDQIVVVDTGSTDGTKKVAQSFNAEVYDYVWSDDFSSARNFAFSLSRCAYNMWLDADDVVPPKTVEAIRNLKENMQAESYFLPYETGIKNGVPALRYYRERILKNTPTYRFSGAVHEAVACPLEGRQYLNAPVCHYPVGEHGNRNLAIYRKRKKEGKYFSARDEYYYARELLFHGYEQTAKKHFNAFLRRKEGWVEDKICALNLLAEVERKNGNPARAKSLLYRAFSYGAPRAETCYRLGSAHLDAGEWESAAFWYESATRQTAGEGFTYPALRGIDAYLQLTVCYDKLGDKARAYEWHKKAFQENPKHPSVIKNTIYFASLGFGK